MKNQTGISKMVVIVLLLLLIAFVVMWFRYFSGPFATVMTGGIERAEPAMDKARQASDAIEKLNRATDETARKLNEEAGQ